MHARHVGFVAAVLLVTAVTYVVWVAGPERILAWIGVENVYLLTFLFAIIGGVSAFTATSFYAALFAFALGGANPYLLALFSAPGVLIGDLVFWYAGYHGRGLAEESFGQHLQRFSGWLARRPAWFVPIVAYAYTAVAPLPGDFLMIAVALAGYPLKKVLLPVLLGNFTIALIVTLSAVYGIGFVNTLFAY